MIVTNLPVASMCLVDLNASVEKGTEILGQITDTELVGIVSNVLHNVVVTEANVNTKMDKKCAREYFISCLMNKTVFASENFLKQH